MAFIMTLLSTLILGMASALAGMLGTWLWEKIIEVKINDLVKVRIY